MYRFLAFIIPLILLCSGCMNSEQGKAEVKEITLADNSHYPVYIDNISSNASKVQLVFNKKPERVVTVGQNTAATMMALGLSDSLVAIVETMENGKILKEEYPQAFEKGNFIVLPRIDKETVLMLEPDLVMAWQSRFNQNMLQTNMLQSTTFWQKKGVMTYIPPSSVSMSKVKTLDLEYQFILDIGKIFAVEEKAEKIVADMKFEIENAVAKTKGRQSPTVLVLAFSRDLVISYGEDSLPGDIVKQAGGTLISTSRYINYEELLQLNPDVMFVVRLDSRLLQAEKTVLEKQSLRSLACVKNKRVHALSINWLYNSSVSSAKGIKAITKGLYPDLYKE